MLIWDDAPAQKTKAVRSALAAAGIAVAWLPFRAPEVNPCEDVGRHRKRVVAANRVSPTRDELADRAGAWRDTLSADAVLRLASLHASIFMWLAT